jgi:predicted Rossmann fold nucleotide-binding protein DprA/Smf involved in DNA uptake
VSTSLTDTDEKRVCAQCLRRGWLLSELSPLLDYSCGDPERLRDLLALPDERLIDALGGRRRASLHAAYGQWRAHTGAARLVLCPHSSLYPQPLRDGSPVAALHIGGRADQLRRLLDAPVVAILGTTNPSDYGRRIASTVARGLTASGITVIAKLEPGIGSAAHRGAARTGTGSLAVAADGLDTARNGPRGRIYAEVTSAGCVLSELSRETSGRSWGSVACERVLLGLASAVVLVEAEEPSRELNAARLAIERGLPVCAVPGPVGSPSSEGPHSLIREGARLVRGARDLLELLYESGEGPATEKEALSPPGSGLAPLPRAVLARVMAGDDTPAKLLTDSARTGETLAALSELEIAGLLQRTSGGRYLPTEQAPGQP